MNGLGTIEGENSNPSDTVTCSNHTTSITRNGQIPPIIRSRTLGGSKIYPTNQNTGQFMPSDDFEASRKSVKN
jgi:hypothetical protein